MKRHQGLVTGVQRGQAERHLKLVRYGIKRPEKSDVLFTSKSHSYGLSRLSDRTPVISFGKEPDDNFIGFFFAREVRNPRFPRTLPIVVGPK